MCGVIVRPVGGRHSHAEACVYTYTILSYTYVVYPRAYRNKNTFKYVNVDIQPYLNTRLHE